MAQDVPANVLSACWVELAVIGHEAVVEYPMFVVISAVPEAACVPRVLR